VSTVVLANHWVSYWFAPLLSLVIGGSFGGLTFLGHETLHGAVVRERRLRRMVGFIGFLPFVISPRLWIAWHNQVHHGNTNRPGIDPDAYPTLDEYGQHRSVRIATDYAAPGRRRFRGVLSLLIGFSVQSAHMLVVAGKRAYLSPREHSRAIAETLLGVAIWSALAAVIGPLPFLFAYVLPLVVANAIVMAFILTNHSLSPLTGVNDALANSLSVTTPRVIDWLTLDFGFHVEHHLFAAMSARHAREVRDVLRARFPEQYQSMPLVSALLALHQSARVYKNPTTLIDPRSGREWPALAPHGVPVR
jgi:fatty acid desaturase